MVVITKRLICPRIKFNRKTIFRPVRAFNGQVASTETMYEPHFLCLFFSSIAIFLLKTIYEIQYSQYHYLTLVILEVGFLLPLKIFDQRIAEDLLYILLCIWNKEKRFSWYAQNLRIGLIQVMPPHRTVTKISCL